MRAESYFDNGQFLFQEKEDRYEGAVNARLIVRSDLLIDTF